MCEHEPTSSSDPFPASEEQRYFGRIEETFLRLRGAPLLLSPKDWQIVRGWYEQGIPADLVERTLAELFERRHERGATGRVSSLSYFRSAIDKVWEEVRQLTSDVSERRAVDPVPVDERLLRLAESLPESLERRTSWMEKIEQLEGDAPAVERALEELDRELLELSYAELTSSDRRQVDEKVGRAISSLRDRLSEAERNEARIRLRNQQLRERLGLPVLSLFGSPSDD